MAVVTNLDSIVDSVVSTNVNVIAANQAVSDSTTKADEAAVSASTAESHKNDAETAVTNAQAEVVNAQAEVTNAAAQVTLAEGHAADAANSAVEAAGYRDTAEGHAITATDQAGIATTKAGEAEAERALAEEAKEQALTYLVAANERYDLFDDRFLGAKGSHPSLDNDGNTLQEAALYWSMVDKALYIYTGTAWVPVQDASGGLAISANLADLLDPAAARTNLDVYSTTETGTAITDEITAQKGAANGLASLNGTGKIPVSELPSYVDDVIEVATYADLPGTGESDKIYVVIVDETSNNDASTYRWSGTVYTNISNTLNAADVKTMYESNTDTNVFTDAEQAKVGHITVTQAVNLDTIENDTDLNNTHRTSDGSDHTFIDQDVTTIGTPNFNSIQLNGGVGGEGTINWNPDENTLDLNLDDTAILQIGQETVMKVVNKSGSPITNGTVVMATGSTGASGKIEVAPHDGTAANVNRVIGIATEDIPDNNSGIVTSFGKVRNTDTSAWAEGDVLFLEPDNGGTGRLTNVMPSIDEIRMPIAFVINSHAVAGILMVRVTGVNCNRNGDQIYFDNTTSGLVAGNTQTAIDEIDSNLDTHIADATNPHSVTAAQVGLDNVDNTSDADKPVSTATQTALDGKLDTTGGTISSDLTVSGNLTVNGTVGGRDIASDGSKLDLVTITQSVDLDTIESTVDGLITVVEW
jgi:hypothetical protein